MVNKAATAENVGTPVALRASAALVWAYVILVGLSLAALIVLSAVMREWATTEAWVHMVIVAVFAIVLPLQIRRARLGQRGAVRAVGLIAAVLFVVNVVEVLVPSFMPAWMQIVMVLMAAAMAGVVSTSSAGHCGSIDLVLDRSETPGKESRRRRSPEERRPQIIRAAAEAVAQLGYANATLTEIAQRSGASKGLLWHYFTDRDDLMHQTVVSLSESLRAGLLADIDTDGTVPDVVRAVFTRTALFTRTHPDELEALDQIVHNLRAPDGRRRISMLDYEAIYAEHTALLTRGQREGTIRHGDLRMMVVSYQALIDGLIGHLQAHPELDPRAHADEVAALFLRGAAHQPEPLPAERRSFSPNAPGSPITS